MSDPFVGKLTYFRVYSGKLGSGSYVLNASTGRKERVGRLLEMHANHREDVEEIGAGAIAAAVGLKQTTTGDTLCAEDAPVAARVDRLPRSRHRRRRRAQDQGRPGQARDRAAAPGRGGSDLPRAHQRGDRPDDHRRHGRAPPGDHRRPPDARVQGRRQRRQAAGRLPRDDAQAPSQGVQGKFVRQTGGRGQYGDAVINLEPNEQGAGYEFVNKIVGGAIPREYISSVDAGIQEAMEAGVLAGFPVVDIKVAAGRRLLPRRRLVGDGVQDRRLDGLQGGCAGAPSRCCSSPSWRSRSSRPRSTWATSSATSTRAAARSRAWSRAATRR